MAFWLVALCAFSGCIIWFDLSQRRVPNRLLIAMLGLQIFWFVACVPFMPLPPAIWQPVIMTHWPLALTTAIVVLVALFPLWRFRAMGAGDVKYAAVLGFCIGPLGLLQVFLIGSVLAGVHAMLYLVRQQAPWLLGRFGGVCVVSSSTPYAAYLAFGVLFGVVWQVFDGLPWLHRLVYGVS